MKKILNFIVGAGIIFGVLYFCTYLLKFLKITFPASILGIIVLFLLLETEIVGEKYIKDFCDFILKYMILFFIPLFVGTVSYFDIISKNLPAVVMTVVLTTTFITAFVGVFVEFGIKYTRLYKLKRKSK